MTDKEMRNAIAHLLTKEQIVAEPAAAATTAAWLADSASDGEQTAVLLVTGANIADAVLRMARSAS